MKGIAAPNPLRRRGLPVAAAIATAVLALLAAHRFLRGRPAVVLRPWKLGFDPDSNQINTEMDECPRVEHLQKCRRRSWSTCPPMARVAETKWGRRTPVKAKADRHP